ncbi:uncharacterized protein LOC135295137 [Passer domesticus]|uniref:uncharacterized protein LOC135295137 n=1 Tax=Passer domesticus TaxID=48849 RepID=UPI0030FE8709
MRKLTQVQPDSASKLNNLPACGFPGEEPQCRRYVTCPGHPRSSCQRAELPHPEPDLESCTRPVHASALERTACFYTVCSREIQLVEERSAVIYLRTPSYSPEGLAAGGGGRAREAALLRARTGTQVEGEERSGDFLGFLPCTYLPGSGSGSPTPLGGRWEAPRLAPASRAPRPRPRSLPVTPASRPRSAPRRAAPHGGAAGSSGTGSADSPPANTRPPARAWNIQKHKGKVAAGLFWGQNAGSLGTTV